MASDKLPKNIPEAEFLEKLFGDVTELSDEELDLMYEAATPVGNASTAMYQLAEQAAVEYRKAGKVPPDHVQAVLQATRPQTTLEGAKASILKNIVESLKAPFVGPVGEPAFSYRNRKDITDKDKTAIDELSKELNEDWEGDQK